MHLIKRIAAATAALVLAMFTPMNIVNIQKAEAEGPDIHITVETKEIDINDIPQNRVVSLNVYTENVPAYEQLLLVFNKSSDVSYALKSFESTVDLDLIPIWINTIYKSDSPDCLTPSSNYMACVVIGFSIDYDGCLIKVNLVLPENVEAGKFYNLDLCSISSELGYETYVKCSDKTKIKSDRFQFTNGGIRITQRDNNSGGGNNGSGGGNNNSSGGGNSGSGGGNNNGSGGGNGGSGGGNSGSGSGNNSGGGNSGSVQNTQKPVNPQTPQQNNAQPVTESIETTMITTEVTSVTDTTTMAQTSTTTAVTTTAKVKTTPKVTVTSVTQITTGSQDEKKKSGGMLTVVIISAIVIGMSSVVVIANKVRRK